tara:strand:+ start:2810 stop:3745 length:936 start_codon:yes stop_codon:yes gene_type:complete
MKTLRYFIISMLVVLLVSCNNKDTTKAKDEKENTETMVKPIKNYLEKKAFQETIDNEVKETIALSNDKLMIDAIEVIEATKEARRSIADSSFADAKSFIELAIGKAGALTALNSKLAFAPVDFTVETHDLVTDISSIKTISESAEEALEEGKIQEARELLQGLRSEMIIKEYQLPIVTYPVALKAALILANEEKYQEANVLLNATLNTIVVENKIIPLPVLRAERMLEEVETLVNKDDFNKDDVKLLLENADYEINFAEALGYGKKDKEYKELYSAIKEVKKQMMDGSNTNEQGLIKKLRKKLKQFKERIS